MKWKYIMIFLMGLLCLVSSEELYSQHCFKMSYDKNGNRITFKVTDCSICIRGSADANDELDAKYENDSNGEDDLFVYPNPNEGKFRVEINSEEENSSFQVFVYDNKGVLVYERETNESIDVDISNNPAGAYLLRIIRDDNVRSVVVVKL